MASVRPEASAKPWWEALRLPLQSAASIERLARTLPNLERDPRFRRGEVQLSLERTAALLAALREPLRALPVLHVAGSKGKGSVCRIASELLVAHGLRVGTYTSPHVERWNERIALDGAPITTRELGRCLEAVVAAARRARIGAPTLFEALTAAAFVAFRRARVDVAVVEVGIGGLLDATNVVASDVAVVTSLEREHTAILGKSLAAIAAQKAGIFKRGAAALSGVPRHRAEAAVLRAKARSVAAPLLEWGGALGLRRGAAGIAIRCGATTWGPLPPPPGGRFAARNAALALAAVDALARRRPELGLALDHERIAAALRRVTLPGRLEVIAERPRTWRDGAHTPRSLRGTVADVAEAAGCRPVLLFALKRDKPLAACLRALATRCGPVVATDVPDGTGYPPKEIVAVARSLGIMARPSRSPADGYAVARRLAGANGALLVTGSFWLAGAMPPRRRRGR
ncbi:MAG: hypothetical protein JNL90_01180 [Planctomycetes bacterium]|nr:hypothetical protein [Planctomycetota bacterium]